MKKNYRKSYIILFLLLIPAFFHIFGFVTSRYSPWWGLREQISAPSTPSNGIKFWCDSNNNGYILNESGSNYKLNIYDPNAGLTDPTSIGTLTLGSGSITDSSGTISFTGSMTATSMYLDGYLYRTLADNNTAIYFRDDRFTTYAGGRTMIDAIETSQDILYLGNDSGADIDISIGPNACLFIEGSSEKVTITDVLEIPHANADVTADETGELFYDESDDQFVFYDANSGELVANEVALSPIKHIAVAVNPGPWYDYSTTIFIMTIGDDAPSGIIIDEWKLSCDADPVDELDADLKYADAYIGLANATVIDALDTTSGVSSEDTDSNINGGSAIPNGKVMYLQFNADPKKDYNQLILEIWYHAID